MTYRELIEELQQLITEDARLEDERARIYLTDTAAGINRYVIIPGTGTDDLGRPCLHAEAES